MAENPAQSVPRRTALTALIACMAVGSKASALRAAEASLPVLRTARHQFTQLEPAISLPSVLLEDRHGRPIPLVRLQGKVLLLNVWATWCEACRTDLLLFAAARARLSQWAAFATVSIDTGGSPRVTRYLEGLGIADLTTFIDRMGRLVGGPAFHAAPLPLVGTPMTYLVAPSGRVAGYIVGTVDWGSDQGRSLVGYYAQTI